MAEATGAPRPRDASASYDDEISLWEILAVILRRRWTIVLTGFVVTVLAILSGFVGARSYTTRGAFRPQSTDVGQSQLASLATQFGVSVGGAGDEASPAFYAELLKSRPLLSVAAEEPYDVEGVGRTTLADLLEIEEDTEALRLEAVYEWLNEEAVSVVVSTETGTVTLTVVTDWPDLSLGIARRLLAELTRFNMEVRQSQAAAERNFIAARVDSAEAELRVAEAELQTFLESNRQWQDAPLLVFQHDRLQREVLRKNSVLETLIQSHEQARIQEVRDTPVITVLQEPYMPPGPDERGLRLRAVLGLVLGGLLGLLLAFVVEVVTAPAPGDRAKEEFLRSWDAMVGSIPFVGGRG